MKGAPLALTPYRDNTEYRKPEFINNFDYTLGNAPGRPPYCPFAAHVRKTVPRNLEPLVRKEYLDAAMIVRAGIPYGEDVSFFFPLQACVLIGCRLRKASATNGISLLRRRKINCRRIAGFCLSVINRPSAMDSSSRPLVLQITTSSLLRASYLRNMVGHPRLSDMMTKTHADASGQDPIIGGPKPVTIVDGQAEISGEGEVTLALVNKNAKKFQVTGFAKADDTSATAFEQGFFVTSHGGEYFFVPSIQTLKDWGAGS
jgi:hypothetical protein